MHHFSPRKILLYLSFCVLLLLILNIASFIYVSTNDLGLETYFFKKFNFDTEKNIPSIFSSLLHFSAAILIFWIAGSKFHIKKRTYFWIPLGILFLFLGFDELLRIHEKLSPNISGFEESSGLFYYKWIIPYGIAVIILGFLFLKPILELPKKTVFGFVAAGCIFILGAVGLEMIGGWFITSDYSQIRDLRKITPIFILYTIEELLEMIGMVYFIYELLYFKKVNTYTA